MWRLEAWLVDRVDIESPEIERKHLKIVGANLEYCDIQTCHEWTCGRAGRERVCGGAKFAQ